MCNPQMKLYSAFDTLHGYTIVQNDNKQTKNNGVYISSCGLMG